MSTSAQNKKTIKKEAAQKGSAAAPVKNVAKSTNKVLNKKTASENKSRFKKSTHPNYEPVVAEFPDGETLEIMSTYGKNLKLDISPLTHHAWAGGQKQANVKEKSVATFNKKWGALSF